MSLEKTLSGSINTLYLPHILSNNLDNDNLLLRRAIDLWRLG
jgi:hypothetical protein